MSSLGEISATPVKIPNRHRGGNGVLGRKWSLEEKLKVVFYIFTGRTLYEVSKAFDTSVSTISNRYFEWTGESVYWTRHRRKEGKSIHPLLKKVHEKHEASILVGS